LRAFAHQLRFGREHEDADLCEHDTWCVRLAIRLRRGLALLRPITV
jgi:hypothetical protein